MEEIIEEQFSIPNRDCVAKEVASELWSDLMKDFEGNQKPATGLETYSRTCEGICSVSTYDQFCSNICGFHALMNAIQMIKFITGDNSSLSKMNSASEFWTFYYETKQYLLNEFPNKKEIASINNLGALDRNHLEFYIENSPVIKNLREECQKKNIKLQLEPFYYGFGIVQHTEEQIENLQQIFDEIAQKDTNEQDSITVMFTGTTNHWVVFLAYKSQVNSNKSTYYFVDSQNLDFNDIISGNIDNLLAFVERRKADRGAKPVQQFHEFRAKVMITSLKDRKDVLLLLKKCFNGDLNLQVCAIEKQLRDFILTFEDYFPQWQESLKQNEVKKEEQPSSMQSEDLRPEMMWMFIKRECPPQVLEHEILNNMRKYRKMVINNLDSDFKNQVISLLAFQTELLNQLCINPCDKDIEILNRFLRGISEISQILSTK